MPLKTINHLSALNSFKIILEMLNDMICLNIKGSLQ